MAKSSGLGARIRALRLEAGWTQSELGRMSGMSQSNLNLIESGGRSNITIDTLQAIAGALHVSTDELLEFDKDAVKQPVDAAAVRRIDAVEKAVLQLGELIQKIDSKIDGQQQSATAPQKKQSRRKRS